MTEHSVKHTTKNITKNTSTLREKERECTNKYLVLGYPIPTIKPNLRTIHSDNK